MIHMRIWAKLKEYIQTVKKTRKYLKLEIKIQVLSISESSGKKNKLFCSCLGEAF